MVVGCPNCKTKLRIPDEKIKPEGTKFKCPKCAKLLNIKKPVPKAKKLDTGRIVVAHENIDVLDKLATVLTGAGFTVKASTDGVETMVKAMNDLPFLIIVDIALPKIGGFEMARRIKSRVETKDMHILLVSSATDQRRQKKMTPSAHGIDAYIDDDKIDKDLLTIVRAIAGRGKLPEPETKPKPSPAHAGPVPGAPAPAKDPQIERAKRLARTVLADIELYSPEKVAESIRNDNYQSVFSEELKEGIRHYENRISAEVRNKGNFFQEAVDEYIGKKRRDLGVA